MMASPIQEKDGKLFILSNITAGYDFVKLFKGKSSPVVLNLKKVNRINSVGIRKWLEGLNEYPNLEIIIEECSREMANRFSTIPGLLGNNQVRVESFCVYYYCEKDDEEEFIFYKEGEHFIWGEGIIKQPDVYCPVCSDVMELDEIPEKYFRFISYWNEEDGY